MEQRRHPRRAYPGPVEERKLPRVRTAANIVKEIKALDPGSDVTEHWVRQLSKSGRVPVVMAGTKILINLDDVLDLLRVGMELPEHETPKAPPPRGIRRIEV